MSDKPTNVLLVEDNPGDARLLREALAESNASHFHVMHVQRLEEALNRLREEEYSVVLLDLSLPDAQGLETVVRTHAQAPHVPIVVLTGLDDESLAIQAVREGAEDYLVKGEVEGRLLARAIRYAIERKRAEEALRESEKRYRLLAENASDVIWTADLNGQLTYISPSVSRVRGYEAEEVINQTLDDVLTPPSCELAKKVLAEELAREGGGEGEPFRAYTLELEHVRKDGSTFWGEAKMTFLRDADGRPVGILGVTRDITERKRAEEERRGLQEQLAQAQKMQAVGTLAGGIAHEFNNINAAIIGYVDLTLQTENLSEGARRNLETVRRSAVRGADLTKSLLVFSRKDVAERKPLELRSVVAEVVRLTEKEFTSEGIEVTVSHSTKAPAVIGDAGLLTQALMNLVINARHAMLKSPVKKLTIETGVENGRAFIRVRDTGCGIPRKHLPRVFEPFFTTKGSLAGGGVYDGKAQGTGLGLSVSHGIVQGHGGEITVKSRVGKGSLFTMYLPSLSRPRTPAKATERAAAGEVQRIMVVDDEEAIVDLLVDILEYGGYAVDGFTSPKEALDALTRGVYSLVFVDLQMPEMKGEDFIERINRIPPERRPAAVVLTGRLDGLGPHSAAWHVFATLPKPFPAQSVLGLAREACSARNGG